MTLPSGILGTNKSNIVGPSGNFAQVTAAGDLQVVNAANSLATNQITVGVTPTLIAAGRPSRHVITIVNHGNTDVFLGGASVSITNGFLLASTKGTAVTLFVGGADLYGIVGTGTQVVSFIDLYD